MKNIYPLLGSESLGEIAKWIRRVNQLRQVEDLSDYVNQKNIYVSGRTVAKVPSNSADVVAGDRLGDVSYAVDGSFMYILVNVSGTYMWGRIAISTGW